MLTEILLAAASALPVAAVDIYNPEPELTSCTGLVWRTGGFARSDGDRLVIEIPKGEERKTAFAVAPIDLSPFAGKGFEAEIVASGRNVTEPFHGYNGVKFQVSYRNPKTGNRVYQDVVERPRGTFDDETLHLRFALDEDVPKDAQLRLGLSESSGTVAFDLGSLRIGVGAGLFRKVNEDYRVTYPDEVRARRRRGVMSPSRDMTEDDFQTLKAWGVNLLRYQMVRDWTKYDDNQDLAEYDRWQDGRLDHLDRFVLPMAERYGIDVVIDLHVFPGGRDRTKESNVLHDRRYAEHFLARWRIIASRFKGRRNVYGYDLVNELNQRRRSDVTDYWNLQREAAEIVRAIDPDTPIIVGANLMENPAAFKHLSPLRMDNVIYQVHMYEPGAFTHYRVHPAEQRSSPDQTIAYPSVREDGTWNRDYLRTVLDPVRRFQRQHGAKIYVGEFSAAAWTKGADRYLSDCISLFEEYGWDWSYHAFREWPGWSVEHEGPDKDHLMPSADNPRKRALLAGFALNGEPAYYGEHLAKVEARVGKLAKECADGFWFITDLHTPRNKLMSGPLLTRLVRTTPLRKVLCGGDFPEAFGGGGEGDKATLDRTIDVWRTHYVRPIEAAGGTVYAAKGNHDFTVRSSAKAQTGFTYPGLAAKRILTEGNERRGVVTNPDDPEACYYYFDNPAAKIRTVVADTTDSVTDRPYWAVAYGMHEKQLKWLDGRAFGTIPDGWSAVVMHHVPVTGVVGSDEDVKNFAAFRELLNKYRDRVLLDLTGHHHCEMQTFQNGIWHVTNPCDAAYGDYINRSKPWCPNLPRKDAGTIYEQTFDAVQIDTTKKLIHFTRVGGGGNRTLHCRPASLSVGETRGFSSLLPGKIAWGCFDADRVDNRPDPTNKWMKLAIYHNDVATISPDGVLTALNAGESVVVALAENGDKELFPVTVR